MELFIKSQTNVVYAIQGNNKQFTDGFSKMFETTFQPRCALCEFILFELFQKAETDL